MIVAFAVGAISAGLLLGAWFLRARSGRRAALVVVLVFAGLTAWAPARVAAATGSTLFAQSFANNTADTTYPVTLPALPTSASGSNTACLTASGNSSSGVLHSCPTSPDPQGSGKLRLTTATATQEGGVFAATSVPTSSGIDATFNTYQYGGTNNADGIAFVLAAVNPANPLSPANIGQSGGALGYSANATSNLVGLANAYMGIGFDTYGNFSNTAYEGSGCTNPAYLSASQVPGQVVIRGPGNGTVGYCAVNSTATTKTSPALPLSATTRAASEVPAEVAINPTSAAFTTASGLTVPAGNYTVVFTPVGRSPVTLSGALPVVPAGTYPSSSWTTASGIPKQLAFGWVASTGGSTNFHEIDAANVVSFTPVPQLAVTQTVYSAASPALGAPVTYTVNPGVSASGASEGSAVSVSETMPAGVTPVGAYGSGWTCAPPSGQVITCTDSATPFAAGTSLPQLTVHGIVTASGVTSSAIQSGSKATASSADGDPGLVSPATAGTVPTGPSGVTVSPVSGTIAGGNDVTVSGTNISGATAIEIGTTSQQQAGTPVVLLPCASGSAAGCFTVNSNGSLDISSMPAVAASATVNVTVVTLGIAGAASYAYTDKPGTPAAPTATAGITSATVTWTAPASNNSPITGYVVTPYLNGVAQTPLSYDASTTTRTLSGLTAGGSYTFTVAAVNAIGAGSASPQSAAVVPYVLPGAPAIGPVSAGDSAATVTWTAPASNGGSAITGYVVTPYIAGVAQTAQTFTSAATTESVTGLTPGTSYTFKVAAVNAAGTGPPSAMSAAVTPNTGPSLTFGPPPAGEVSIAYSDQLTASAGTGALAWSVSSGSLPPGLSLNPSTGLLSGTPTTAGSYGFTVKITDTAGGSATKPVTLVIAAAPSLANAAPPPGQAAVAYSDQLAVTGGTGPFTWAVSGGSLPAGLTLNPSTGLLSGTPTTVGLSTFTVKVTDSLGLTATQSLNLTVAVGPLVINATANASTVAQGGTLGYTVTVTNTGASAYSGVTFSAALSDVLDDAVYNNDAAATAGTVTVTGQTLTWTGSLAAGAAATITFSATVNTPYAGNGTLAFTVTSPTTGTNCPPSSSDARCGVSVPVSALTITQTASAATAAPGTVVGYTITVTNSGLTAYSGATLTDPLTGVLGNAAYTANAAATAGTVSYASPNLTWTGNLAAGATATITFTVTVNNPDAGSKILASTITSATAGTNCPAGGTDARCTATVTVQGLTITSTASTASATPGAAVQYTVTVTNSGQAAYTGATFTDSLSGVLDDAVYNGDAAATAGSVSYASPNLTWAGNLAPGATATITFSVTVNNPDTGDKVLATMVTSATPASNCPAGGTNPACSTSVTVLVPALTIATSPGVSSTTPGSTVAYTVTVTNSGQTPYTGTSAVVSLAGVLDDAAYNGDAAATAGAVSYTSPNLTWTGTLAPGAAATITYSVRVDNPDTGNHSLATAVTSAAAGSNCPSGGSDPRCSSTVPVLVPGLTLAVGANNPSTTAGSVVRYTVTAANTGQTTDTGVSFTDSLAGVLDDAAYNGDASASTGAVSFASPNLTWTGSLAPGATATVTFSVTVNNPDVGNKILTSTLTSAAAGSNCPAGGTAPACSSAVTVGSLTINNTSNVATTTPGGVVRFTSTFTNTGQAAYTGITVASNIGDVLDDATPNGDQTATSGTLTLSSTGISWTGSIPVGGTVTVTGTVTVNNPDSGNKVMTSTLSTGAAGSNCPAGGTDPACSVSVTVLIPGLTIVKTANTSAAVPGSVVGYTVTVTDSGQTPYSGAVVTDDLSGVLNDTVYDGDAAATAGTVGYAAPVLTWTGSLSPGGSATITYTVTVNNPDTGGKLLINTVASSAVGSSCPPGTTSSPCQVTIPVLTPALTIVAAAATTSGSNAVAVPGGVVSYRITVTNTGQVPYTGAAFTDPLGGVLDDAAYDGAAAATAGSVSFARPDLTWTGDLAPGAAAVITFSVTVNNPDTGDQSLAGTVTSATSGSNCPAGGTDARCAVTVAVVGASTLTFTQAAAAASAVAGGTVNYTITIANSGASPYTGASFTDPLGGVLDDAAYGGDAHASSGTVSYASPVLSWAGNVPANGTVTITYTVTVSDPDTGNMILASTITSPSAGSNCPAASPGSRCTATVTVSELTMVSTASPAAVTPGGTVNETTTISNTGQTPYNGISVAFTTGNTAAQISDAGNETASSGTLSVGATGAVWTGDVPVGATVTITGSIIVANPYPAGSQVIALTGATTAPGSNCPAGSADPRCTATANVLIPGLTIVKTANTSAAVPGSVVGYTVRVTDSGQTSYTGAVVTDDLSGALNDAAYNGNASATAGTVSYAARVLTWTGSLSPGDSATITYTVTVNNPDTGGKLLINTVASSAVGSSCPPGTTSAACQVTVPVLTPALTIVKTASSTTAAPGQTVTYTVTVTDSGQTPYTGATLTDPLAGVLGDAAYDNDAAATAGNVSYASPDLTWTGNLAPGASATITYSVTVDNPDTGSHVLTNTVTSTTPGSNCPSGGTDPRCTATTEVSQLTIVNTASTPTSTPGGVVGYTITATNSGQTALVGATLTAGLAPVLDDAAYNGDATATTGGVALSADGQGLTWTGNLAVGATVTITYSVTVNNPDTGDKILTNTVASATPGSTCPAGSASAACTALTTVLIPGLTITNAASTSTPVPGSVIGYTVTITDTGETAYTGVTVTDTIAPMLGDAAYNGNAAATAGGVSYASGVLTWTGTLAPGASAVVTFSVTVNSPDTGGKVLIATASSAAPGSTCPPGTTTAPCRSTVGVLTPGLGITATAGAGTAVPGATVHYTVTITDTGQTPYTGAVVTDDLTGLLDDAAYNGDAAATVGTVAYASPALTWTGSLAPGVTVTVTYSATVNNPDTGNRLLATLITTTATGSNCAPASTDPSCATTIPVAVLAMTNTASTSTTTPGSVVGYTVTVANTGQVPIANGTLTVPLSGVLDDAAYDGDAAASAGTVSFASPDLTWTGTLAVGATATITFSVTVSNPDTGSKTLTDTITSTTPGSTCPASGAAPAACTAVVTVLIPALTITQTADVATTTPGSVVRYTITVADTGQTSYTGATVTDDLTSVMNDAAYNGDAAATAGTVSYASSALTWTGDLAPGDTAVITYSVTVNNPDTGDKHLNSTAISAAPGSTCPPAAPAPACTATVTDLIPALTIIKTASTVGAAPGSAVDYTITVADTGQTSYTGATVTDDLAGVLGAAAYNGDAAATAGTVSYASPALAWTGSLTPGDTAVITYSVTVDNPETGGTSLVNTVTSAAAGSSCRPGTSSGQCTVTTGVISGPLTITAPATADLGAGPPGATIQGGLGTVQVTDGRGFGADWTATVSSGDFTTGAGAPAQTIPAGDATYAISGLTTATGPATFGYAPETDLSQNPQNVVDATNVNGNTTVTWNPLIQVTVPGGAIGGAYSATIVHSVS